MMSVARSEKRSVCTGIHSVQLLTSSNVLYLSKFGVLHHLTGRIARVGSQYHGGSSRDLIGNLLRVDVIAIGFGKR